MSIPTPIDVLSAWLHCWVITRPKRSPSPSLSMPVPSFSPPSRGCHVSPRRRCYDQNCSIVTPNDMAVQVKPFPVPQNLSVCPHKHPPGITFLLLTTVPSGSFFAKGVSHMRLDSPGTTISRQKVTRSCQWSPIPRLPQPLSLRVDRF